MLKKFSGRLTLVVCLIVICACLLCGCESKSNPYLPSANIDITLNSDGSADIREVHEISFDRRGDPWWNYFKTVDVSLYNTDIRLEDVGIKIDGKAVPVLFDSEIRDPDDFTSADKHRYANKGYVYNRSKYCELGVFFSEFRSGIHTVEFSYRLTNLVAIGQDCSEFYYKFVDESNEMTYEKITATVNFDEVSREDVLVWTHLEYGNGEGIIPDGERVTRIEYTVKDLVVGEYFETRLVLPKENFSSKTKTDDGKDGIIAEEKGWYDKFVSRVRLLQAVQVIDYILLVLVAAATVLLIIYFLKKRKPLRLDGAPTYLREIPKGWSAPEAAHLYYYYGKYDVGNAISATVLELFRKKFIDIRVGDKKKEAEITVFQNKSTVSLLPHELTVYNMLAAAGNGSPFTMKKFEKTAKNNSELFAQYIEEFKDNSKKKVETGDYLPKRSDDVYARKMSSAGVFFIVAGLIFIIFSFVASKIFAHVPFTVIPCILGGIAFIVAPKLQKQPLAERGQRQYDEFKALEKFMTEFSNLDRHELPALMLWEEYMVYATAMGIADKVSEQLEIAYPEYNQMVSSARGYDDYHAVGTTFFLLYLMSPRLRFNFGLAMCSTLSGVARSVMSMNRNAKILSAAKDFSSHIGKGGGFGGFGGGGGGFSGGGGGFGGGGSHAR